MIPSGATFGSVHTYRDLNMIPKSKLTFAPCQPKFLKQDSQGMNGDLDYTNLFGGVNYENSKGEFRFLVLTGSNYTSAYTQMLSLFNGQVLTCKLDDEEGNVTYTGRFAVSEWKPHGGRADMTLTYNVKKTGGS